MTTLPTDEKQGEQIRAMQLLFELKDLPCDAQFYIASALAGNVGYQLILEPEHPDNPHARPLLQEEGREDDADVSFVARAIAERGFGRSWDDFLPVNAHDVDQGDLTEYAQAAVAAMRGRFALPPSGKVRGAPPDYPTPWIVGPFGDIWVAADVEFKDGKWRETCPEPRIVVTLGLKDQVLGEFIVSAVNGALSSPGSGG